MAADSSNIRKTIYMMHRVKTWQLLVILLLMAFVAVTLLRLNNIGMVQRRDAAIKATDPSDARARLADLQAYSMGHMNADTGVFYLEGLFGHDAQVITNEIQQATGTSATVDARADAICKPLSNGYTREYQDCMIREITKGGQVVDPLTLPKYPNQSLYRYSFFSPLLSFDFAGLAVVACFVIALIIVVRSVSLVVLKLLLKHYYRGV